MDPLSLPKKVPPVFGTEKNGRTCTNILSVYVCVLLHQNELKPTGLPACHIHSTYRISYNVKTCRLCKILQNSFTPVTFCAIVCLLLPFFSHLSPSPNQQAVQPTNSQGRSIVSSRPTEGTHRFFGTSTNQRLFDLRESKTVKLLGDENLPIIEHHHEKSTICRCISYLHIPP